MLFILRWDLGKPYAFTDQVATVAIAHIRPGIFRKIASIDREVTRKGAIWRLRGVAKSVSSRPQLESSGIWPNVQRTHERLSGPHLPSLHICRRRGGLYRPGSTPVSLQ